MKLLVRNLSRKTAEAELQKLFEEFGKVEYCTIVMDQETGASKGFGFVEIKNMGQANMALRTMNGKVIDGSKIRVKKAKAEKSAEDVAPSNPWKSQD